MDNAADLINRFISDYMGEKDGKIVSLFSSWNELLDPDLRYHAEAVDIKNNALVVEIDHPGWMQIFRLKQKQILKRVQKKYPELNINTIQMKLVAKKSKKSMVITAPVEKESIRNKKVPDKEFRKMLDRLRKYSDKEGKRTDVDR
jgi:hypothetical protein